MRKMILYLIILTMVLAPAQIFAEDDILPDDVYIVEHLDIAAGIDENQTSGITRAEFLSWVLKAARIELIEAGETPLFTDVTSGHTYASEIATAHQYSVINGCGNGRFYPDDYINIEQAKVMIINAMGQRYASTDGTYVAYNQIADGLGLLEDVTNRAANILTRRNAVVMIYNMLNAPEVLFVGSNLKMDTGNGKTFMGKVWDLYTVKGVVEATAIADATGNGINGKNARIDNVIYNCENFSVNHLLGFAVKAFYYDMDGENSLVYVYPTKKNKVVEITNERLEQFQNNKFTFQTDVRNEEYEITPSTSVVWNNTLLSGTEFNAKLNSKSAEFTFISNDGDKIYDYVIVKDATVYVPNLIDVENLILGAADRQNIDLKEYESYSIADIDGVSMDFGDIKTNQVALVYDSGNKNSHLEICIIKNAVSDTAGDIDFDDNLVTLSDGREYVVSTNSAYPISKWELNVTYSIYFDKTKRIVHAEVEKRNGFVPIYIMRKIWSTEEELILRSLNADGEFVTYDVAKKLNLRLSDGVTSRVKEYEAYTSLGGGTNSFKRQLVLVKFNSDDEINTIYTVSEDEDLIFHNPHPQDHNAYRWLASQYSFENIIQLKANTKVFFVPDPNATTVSNEFFYVGDVSRFRNDTAYQNVTWYPDTGYGFKPITLQPDSLESDYLVIECPEGAVFSEGSSCYGIVTEVKNSYSVEHEELCKKVVIMNMSGVEQSFYYFQTGQVSKVDIGDIVQIQYSSTKIQDRDIYMYYDCSADTFGWYTNFDNTIGWRYYAGFRVTRGEVIKVDNGIAKCNLLTTGTTYQNEYVKYNSSKVLKLDKDSGTYKLMDGNHLKRGDKFFAIMSGGVGKMFIFYEDVSR